MHEEAYGRFSERLFDAPAGTRLTKAHFEITYRCNLHCVHCYTDPFNRPEPLRRELSFDGIVRLLDDLAQAGVLWLTLSGGEAAAHPRFREIYQAAKARGFLISLLSNGTVLSSSLVDFLAEDPPFQLEISLHGASAVVFEAITQVPGSWTRFAAGLERAQRAGLPVRMKTNAMQANDGELGAIRRYLEDRGLEMNLYTILYPRLDGDTGPAAQRLPAGRLVALEKAQALAQGVASEACRSGAPLDDRLFRCGCGTQSVTIDPYGFLRACTFTVKPSYDLRALTVPEAFERLARDIQAARYTGDSPCRTCEAHAHCDKNPAMARHEAGSEEAPVPHFCDVAFERLAPRRSAYAFDV